MPSPPTIQRSGRFSPVSISALWLFGRSPGVTVARCCGAGRREPCRWANASRAERRQGRSDPRGGTDTIRKAPSGLPGPPLLLASPSSRSHEDFRFLPLTLCPDSKERALPRARKRLRRAAPTGRYGPLSSGHPAAHFRRSVSYLTWGRKRFRGAAAAAFQQSSPFGTLVANLCNIRKFPVAR